jgi:MFS family permease
VALLDDRRILLAAAFARSLATGSLAVVLGLFLARIGFDGAAIGGVVGAGLAGCAAAALLVTLVGDRLGRRRSLVGLALLGGAGTALAATVALAPAGMAALAFVGMLNGMGRDRGAALVLDQAILPSVSGDADRTLAFAWYAVLQDAGHALGALLAATPPLLRAAAGLDATAALRVVLLAAAALHLLTAALYAGLTPAAEAVARARRPPVTPATRGVLTRISALFGLDAVAGGFLTSSLLAYFFYERFGVGEGSIGLLFFGARIANAASHLGAAWLARRFGLLNTMVFTHVPSSLLLLTVPLAPSFWVAASLFLVREGLVEMDVPTRQSYLMAVVPPEARTLASGVTSLVRLAGWAVAPALAGALMAGAALATPLVAGAAMKLAYDGLLYASFRKLKPPEER